MRGILGYKKFEENDKKNGPVQLLAYLYNSIDLNKCHNFIHKFN
jgi:hypothetical protein